jgi:hypothetical protein
MGRQLPLSSLIADGLTRLRVWCCACQRGATVEIAGLAVPPDTALDDIPFACARCGNRGPARGDLWAIQVMPDWPSRHSGSIGTSGAHTMATIGRVVAAGTPDVSEVGEGGGDAAAAAKRAHAWRKRRRKRPRA